MSIDPKIRTISFSYTLLFAGLFLGFLLSCFFFYPDYPAFIRFLRQLQPEIYDIQQINQRITASGYQYFKLSFFVLTGLLCFSFFFLNRKIVPFFYSFIACCREIKGLTVKAFSVFQTLNTMQAMLFACCMAGVWVHQIILMYNIPLFPDEVFAYVFFVRPPFWISCIYYPEPNNHILFNLIGSAFQLVTDDPMLCVRLPSLLFYSLTLLLVFVFTHKKFGFPTAIAAFVLCAFAMWPSFYAAQGRGYILLSFFSMMAALSMYFFCSAPEKKIYLKSFIVCSILGAYTIPVFLFPFISLIVYPIVFGKNNPAIRKGVLDAILITGIAVFILYLPVICLNGPEALFANKWVKNKDIVLLVDTFHIVALESVNYVWSVHSRGYLIMLPFLSGCLYLLLNKKKSMPAERNWILLFFTSLFTICVLVMLLRNYPPYRVWTYFAFISYLTLAIVSVKILSLTALSLKIQYAFLGGCLMVYVFCMVSNLPPRTENITLYGELEQTTDSIYRTAPSSVFISDHELLEYYLRLHYRKDDPTINIDIAHMDPRKAYDWVVVYGNKKMAGFDRTLYAPVFHLDDAVIFKKLN